MTRRRIACAGVFAVVAVVGGSAALGDVTIQTVSVGDVGHAADPGTGYGAVAYAYGVGAYEVTAGQYAAFLNAVARTDTHALYHPSMANAALGCGITRAGASGAYTYGVVAGLESRPVNYVSFWDALRFANWLHNGQPTGAQGATTTEDGAYTLTPGGVGANSVTRNAGWRWAVAGENEWFKAAYFQPAAQGGDADGYWLYPTSTNTISTAHANYDYSVGATTPVGSYAPNFRGAWDMGGNVWEWNESIVLGTSRGLRGGALDTFVQDLRADARSFNVPTGETDNIGFRVVRAATGCAADVNGDGVVNSADLAELLGRWGDEGSPGAAGDLNNDGVVNSADLAALLGQFGSGC